MATTKFLQIVRDGCDCQEPPYCCNWQEPNSYTSYAMATPWQHHIPPIVMAAKSWRTSARVRNSA
eukprot:11186911-Lingulodinium_polyedra.AAC.1